MCTSPLWIWKSSWITLKMFKIVKKSIYNNYVFRWWILGNPIYIGPMPVQAIFNLFVCLLNSSTRTCCCGNVFLYIISRRDFIRCWNCFISIFPTLAKSVYGTVTCSSSKINASFGILIIFATPYYVFNWKIEIAISHTFSRWNTLMIPLFCWM